MRDFNKWLIAAAVAMLGGLVGCSEDEMTKSAPDYDPNYKGSLTSESADYSFDANAVDQDITFTSDRDWTATMYSGGEVCTWASVSPSSGTVANPAIGRPEGEESETFTVTVHLDANESLDTARECSLQIATDNGTTYTVTFSQDYKLLDPSEIPDYDKYICPSSGNEHFSQGAEYMLRHDAYYSWHRMKQSEHFFVFWSPEFGDDPNAESVDAAMRVDVDDLLEKAEMFFNTNVNVLKMATLGEGKSMLDNYKMQIYLIYQDEWLATGSGYDNKIGALWVNPSTCQPVGSTIGHEIGHSFQYQVYADKINMQGADDDLHHGFRYGFGPDGAGGCAFWEQCAQWQSLLDYPGELFGDHISVWQGNCHRHFNHEWQRYASYWMQTYWVEKFGIDAFGRIWQESEYPEDPLQTYQRLFLGGDQDALYADLYDYAAHMVYYDFKYSNFSSEVTVPDEMKGAYTTSLYKIGDLQYQVGYSTCPGTTGFNVIKLKVPEEGTTVTTTVAAIAPGSALAKHDSGEQVNGDGEVVSKTTVYNTQDNTTSNYRYGYVSIVGGMPVYSEMSSGANGSASLVVSAGTEELYFVIVATPDTYNRHYWNDDEGDDEQWPYSITLSGTDVDSYNEVIEVVIDPDSKPTDVSVTINVKGTESSTYEADHINLAYLDDAAICYAFCLTPEEIAAIFTAVNSSEAPSDDWAEGKIYVRLKQDDGTYCYADNCGGELGGFWCGATGNPDGWGENGRSYTKFHTIYDCEVGFMPEMLTAGETYPEIVEMVYTTGGQQYIATLNFNFIVE